jgi:hypothetical protein
MQTKNFTCKCGRLAIARKKSTREWICVLCMVKEVRKGRGVNNVRLALINIDTLESLAPLAVLQPIRIYRN